MLYSAQIFKLTGIATLALLMSTVSSNADDEMERDSRGNRSSSEVQKRRNETAARDYVDLMKLVNQARQANEELTQDELTLAQSGKSLKQIKQMTDSQRKELQGALEEIDAYHPKAPGTVDRVRGVLEAELQTKERVNTPQQNATGRAKMYSQQRNLVRMLERVTHEENNTQDDQLKANYQNLLSQLGTRRPQQAHREASPVRAPATSQHSQSKPPSQPTPPQSEPANPQPAEAAASATSPPKKVPTPEKAPTIDRAPATDQHPQSKAPSQPTPPQSEPANPQPAEKAPTPDAEKDAEKTPETSPINPSPTSPGSTPSTLPDKVAQAEQNVFEKIKKAVGKEIHEIKSANFKFELDHIDEATKKADELRKKYGENFVQRKKDEEINLERLRGQIQQIDDDFKRLPKPDPSQLQQVEKMKQDLNKEVQRSESAIQEINAVTEQLTRVQNYEGLLRRQLGNQIVNQWEKIRNMPGTPGNGIFAEGMAKIASLSELKETLNKHFDSVQDDYLKLGLLTADFKVLKAKAEMTEEHLEILKNKAEERLNQTVLGSFINDQIKKLGIALACRQIEIENACKDEDAATQSGKLNQLIESILIKRSRTEAFSNEGKKPPTSTKPAPAGAATPASPADAAH